MQPHKHVHAHRHAGDELAIDRFRGRLAVFRCLRNGPEQRGLDEAEIDIGDALRRADVAVIRRQANASSDTRIPSLHLYS